MTDRSYPQSLDRVLLPEGFVRDGRVWARIKDGCRDMVYVQSAAHLGTTVDLLVRDLATEQILLEALPEEAEGLALFCQRLGELIDGNDRWWRREKNGPEDMAEAVQLHGLPYFERFRSLEEQARLFGRLGRLRPGELVSSSRLYLAITLYRMGLVEEACTALQPRSRRETPDRLARIDAIRRRIGCKPLDIATIRVRPAGPSSAEA